MTRCITATLALGLLVQQATFGSAATIDVASVLGNISYEEDLVHSQWSATKPNSSYSNSVPVNPAFTPLNPSFSDGTTQPAPTAPVGDNYIAVLNPTENDDIKGRLVHDAQSVAFTSADEFQVVLWGNRGRLGSNGNTNSTFDTVGVNGRPKLTVQLFAWGPGSLPTVNMDNDWSRNPTFKSAALEFTNWAGATEWASQLFTFSPGIDISYLALGVSGQNRNHDQYTAWDIGPVPEPSTVVLATIGVVGLTLFGWRRRRS